MPASVRAHHKPLRHTPNDRCGFWPADPSLLGAIIVKAAAVNADGPPTRNEATWLYR